MLPRYLLLGLVVVFGVIGHLVFSTLHIMGALITIPRLLDLGIRSSFIADTLLGAIAQRLLGIIRPVIELTCRYSRECGNPK